MDPDSITATVLTALAAAGAAGAADGVQEATSDAVQRAYDRLRDSLRALWGRRSTTKNVADAEQLVEKFQEEPDVWADDLRQLLVAAGADNDIELNRRSLELLSALELQNRRQVFFINSQGVQYNNQKTKKPRQVNVFPPRYG